MRIMLISGSTRPGSSNTLALRKLHEREHADIDTDLYVELHELPGFVPGQDPPRTAGGGQLHGIPVAWLEVANPGRGDGARAQLRTVLGYVGAHIVEKACVHITVDGADDQPFPARQHSQLSVALADAVTGRQS